MDILQSFLSIILLTTNDINEKKDKKSLKVLSEVLGWIYFVAWSVSFYGQVIENYRRHKVSGLNFDFEALNLLGYLSYTTYNVWGYIDKNLGTGQIKIQDICFAAHGLLLTIITICQIIYYYDKTDKDQKVHNYSKVIIGVLVFGALCILFVERILKLYNPKVTKESKYVFNLTIYLGWLKVIFSFIKYIPQAVSNHRRKSTIGWNIHNILLDFTGGIFSFAQIIVDVIRDSFTLTPGEQSPSLNIAKFGLSIISIFFDTIFMVQHFILYKDSNSDLKPKVKAEEYVEKEGLGKEGLIPEDTV